MGPLLGNLIAAILTAIAALIGLYSLQASAISYVVVAYGSCLLVAISNYYLGHSISNEFQQRLNKSELRAFRRYNVHVRAPAAGEIFSAWLNLLRFAGFVWAGLCIWQGHYVLAGLSGAFFFSSA